MKEHSTIPFIPERINRRPAIYRGMTMYELFIAIIIGFVIGLIVGIFVMLLFDLPWATVATTILLFLIISVRFSGSFLSRLKRGKPETWLERYIELKKKPSQFITQNQFWLIKRLNSK